LASLDDLMTGKGLAISVGAILLAPVVLPALAGLARPMAKAAIKGGILVYEKSRETAAELSEVFEDLVAEAKAELKESSIPADSVPPPEDKSDTPATS
jgi:hypothetical protein